MTLREQIAKQIRELYFGGTWTDSNIKDTLADISWQEATTVVYSFNTIATLVYHTNYFTCAVLNVLQGEELNAHDKLSFNHPPINNQQDWEKMLVKTFTDAEIFAGLVEELPEHRIWGIFSHEKYGTYYRNLLGIIEHTHYHLGQIVLIKKIIHQQSESPA